MMKQPRSSRGFTLIELLTVIAIIGILAGLIIPTVGLIRGEASKARAKSNIRQIANAYASYAYSGSRILNITETDLSEWAGVLAVEEDLWDAKVYYIDSDSTAPNELPTSVGSYNEANKSFTANSDFTNQSVEVVSNLSKRPGKTLPVVWSRGLDHSGGDWDITDSAFGSNGGILAKTDGSVEFYDKGLGEGGGVLLDYNTNDATASVTDALNDDADIIEP